jgi:hypothetical protein
MYLKICSLSWSLSKVILRRTVSATSEKKTIIGSGYPMTLITHSRARKRTGVSGVSTGVEWYSFSLWSVCTSD